MTQHPSTAAPLAEPAEPFEPPSRSHYLSNRRDLDFVLFELLGRGEVLGSGPWADLDPETARDALDEVDRLAREQLAPSFAEGDRRPPTLDPATGSVHVTDAFADAYRAYRASQWWRFDVPPALGGTPCPPSLRWAVQELVLGANPAIHMYGCGSAFAGVLHELGTPDQQRLAALMVEHGWGSSMVLTEPDAGSDVGAGLTRATAQPDGSWHLEGTKRFITNGDHDLTENIVHLVLARPEGAGPGTKGLSLFVVPKYYVDLATGALGERNGIRATRLEHKMGLRVSATCELELGLAGTPAVGWLVGDVHDGIAQMFRLIEDARMMVGAKAMATLSTAYLNTLAYARARVQGPDLASRGDRTAPRVATTHHPDVRRMLLTMKAQAEGLRALVLYAASVQDEVRLAAARGEDAAAARARNDLLLPLVKGYGSERCSDLLGDAVQTVGGAGYLQDHPFEQYVRDARIDTLYEGTTGIQGMDLFFRKVVRDDGRALNALVSDIAAFAAQRPDDDPIAAERDALAASLADVRTAVDTMVGWLRESRETPGRVYRVGENTTRLLMMTGDLVVAWLLLRSAEVADNALRQGGLTTSDRAFYAGKVGAARWFARTALPGLSAELSVLEATSDELMALDESAF